MAKPNKVNIGNECPVCEQAISKQHSRVHVIWHFMEELRGIVQSFNNPTVRLDMKPDVYPFFMMKKDKGKGYLLTVGFPFFRFVTSATTRTKTSTRWPSILLWAIPN